MHSSVVLSTFAALAAAAPAAKTSSHIVSRNDPTQCTLTGWNIIDNNVQFIGAGQGSSTSSATSKFGFDLGAEGHGTLHSCSNEGKTCNPLAVSITLKASDLQIDQDVHWHNGGQLVVGDCQCTVGGVTYPGTNNGSIFTGIVYNREQDKCTCQFPCTPTTVTVCGEGGAVGNALGGLCVNV